MITEKILHASAGFLESRKVRGKIAVEKESAGEALKTEV